MKPNPACTHRTSPIAPSARTVWSRRIIGLNFIHMASMRKTPRSAARAARERAWAASTVIAFSQSTCLPASIAVVAISKCVPTGVQR